MIRLNTSLLSLASSRGAGRVLQPTLMAFKMQAYPLLQKAFGAELDSLKRLADGGAPGEAAGLAAGLGGFVRAATGGGWSGKEAREFAGTVSSSSDRDI